jgi:hypothetical protein
MEPNNQPINPQQNNSFDPNQGNQTPPQVAGQQPVGAPAPTSQPAQPPTSFNQTPQFSAPAPAQPQFSANNQSSGGGKKTGTIVGVVIGVVLLLGLLGFGGFYAFSMMKKDNYQATQKIQTAVPNVSLTAPAPLKKVEPKDAKALGFKDGVGDTLNDSSSGIKLKDEGIYAQFEDPDTKKRPVAAVYYVVLDFSSLKDMLDATNELALSRNRQDLVMSEEDFLKKVRKEFVTNGQSLSDELKNNSGSDSLTFTEAGSPVAVGNGVEFDFKAEAIETKQQLTGKVGVYLDNEWNLATVIALAETDIWTKNTQSFDEAFKSFRGGEAAANAVLPHKKES